MLNTLIAINDQLKINRLASVLKSDKDFSFAFFSNSMEAVEYVNNLENDIDIAIISVDMSILNGAELAEVVADRNFKCRFVFIFDEGYIDEAVSVYNMYDYSMLIPLGTVEPEGIRFLLNNLQDEILSEKNYDVNLEMFREKEKISRVKLSEMTDILNARIAGYERTINFYSQSVECLLNKSLENCAAKITHQVAKILNEYVSIFLNINEGFDELYNKIALNYSDPEQKKFFQLNRCDDITDHEAICTIGFVTELLCNTHLGSLKAYRAKVDQSLDNNYYKTDILIDARMGYYDKNQVQLMQQLSEGIVYTLSDKFEKAAKDGVIHYRVYFDRNENVSGNLSNG